MTTRSGQPRRSLASAVLRGAAAVGLALGLTAFSASGASAAQQVALTLTYTCDFPVIGQQSVTINLDASAPNSVVVGSATAPIVIDASVNVPWEVTTGLRGFGASSVSGTVAGQANVDAPQGASAKTVPFDIPKIVLPGFSSFTASATGTMPSMTFSKPGTAKITVGNLTARLVPRDSNGNLTRLGVINVPCTLSSPDNVAASIAVVAASGSTSGAASADPSTPNPSGSSTGSHDPASASAAGSASGGSSPSSSESGAALTPTSPESSQLVAGAKSTDSGDSAWVFGIVGLIAVLGIGGAAFRYGPRLWRR